ncbi:MAG TPA: sigma factor [Burkholderiales bacterium]|nr:sigma factor [Burkholderiales bacterium]
MSARQAGSWESRTVSCAGAISLTKAVHDGFLQIWQKAVTFDPARGSARGWIYTVVRHRALNILRDSSREIPSNGEQFEEVSDAETDPLTIYPD